MDWLNELPPATGIEKVVGEMAKRLLEGPVVFRSPFWDGDIKIETLNDYCAWARFACRMDNERGAEGRALEIWEEEYNRISVGEDESVVLNTILL
jgi:hypothetical protein